MTSGGNNHAEKGIKCFLTALIFGAEMVALILGFPPPKNSPDICNGKFTMLRAWPYGNKLWDNAQGKGGKRRRAQEGARSSNSPMRVLISCSMQTGKKISFLSSFCFQRCLYYLHPV